MKAFLPQVDSVSYASSRPDSGYVAKQHHPLTPAQVLSWLPYNATPAQQDSAIQAHFQPKEIHWSQKPDTLGIPGLNAPPASVIKIPSYKDGFFTGNPVLHPELRVTQIGMPGDPMPYRLRTDDFVTSSLLLSFFLMVFVITRSSRILLRQIKDIFYTHTNDASSFNTDTELRGQLFLIFQTCFLLAILFFDYTQEQMVDVFNQISPYKLLGLDVGICIAYYGLKIGLYSFVNWVFFSRKQNIEWLETLYLTILGLGVFMLPVALLVVYFDLSLYAMSILLISTLFLLKILLFQKCYRIFFSYRYGSLHLILYFCTLEMLPLLALWRALVYANKCMIVYF